ncbi:MAG: TRAP transporter large permease [Usitatibacter sp.]
MIWLVALLLALFLVGMPIVFAVGFVSAIYAKFVAEIPLTIIPQQLVSGIDSFVLLAIPLFLLTGGIMSESGITRRLLHFSESLVGWMRGGLAQVNVLTNVFMAGISGSGLADAAATGSALIPLMKQRGYGVGFAAAVTAAASCIGPIIPPSIIMVVIGGLTSASVGRMFLGGVVPGLMLGLAFGLCVHITSVRRNYPKGEPVSMRTLARSFLLALPALGLPVIIIAGILSGAFTPTEAAAVACVYTILFGLISRELRWKAFYRAVVNVGTATGTIMFIVGVSSVFGWILVSEDIGTRVADGLLSITRDPRWMMLLIVACLLVLGCFVEVMALLILTVPILMPLVETLGIDPVHFGVVATIALTTGLITPPFGLCMFMMCSIGNVRIEEFAREIWPFIACIVVGLLLFIFFPELVVYVPNAIMGPAK